MIISLYIIWNSRCQIPYPRTWSLNQYIPLGLPPPPQKKSWGKQLIGA